jgi:hypothetical protein
MIDHSYELVVAGLTKKIKAELEELTRVDQENQQKG